MTDDPIKLPQNVQGKFYVNDHCIDCGSCYSVAPDNFAVHPDTKLAYVFRQPRNKVEDELCSEAMEGCPTEAIDDDGEQEPDRSLRESSNLV